jgi:hypothetical protein
MAVPQNVELIVLAPNESLKCRRTIAQAAYLTAEYK